MWRHLKKLWFIPPALLGLAVLVIAVRGQQAPERTPAGETARKVRVISVPAVAVVPRALGYGYVRPGLVWEAVAEVGGRIVEVHPQLKEGAILAKGETLLRIDPTDYRLVLAEIEADMRGIEGQLEELRVKQSNARASLEIEERTMLLVAKDLDRKRQLLRQKAVSQAAVDQEERNVLGRQQNVQSLNNTLNLIPAERQVLEARLAQYRAKAEAARLDLGRTTVVAPFDSRIAEVNVEKSQFAAKGKVLAVADSIDVSEVSAQLPIGKLIHVIRPDAEVPADPIGVMGRLAELLGLSATVRLRTAGVTAEWPARFARIGHAVDPKTRTASVVVAVDDPYRGAVPAVRPPLVRGMYVEVELRGRPRPGQLVIPRAAVHGRRVYVADKDNRLERREVEVAFFQTNFAVLKSGLAEGERVVLSDLIPAIDGMLLDPVVDEAAAASLVAEARGEGGVR